MKLLPGAVPRRTAASRHSALRAPRWAGGNSFGFVALSGPNSTAGLRHQSQTPASVRGSGLPCYPSRHAPHFHRFRVPQRGMTTLRNSGSDFRGYEFRNSAPLSHGEKLLPTVRQQLSRAACPPPAGAYRILAACRTCRHVEAC